MRLLLLAGLVLLAACAPAARDTPEDAYRAFAEAANRGEAKVAFGWLASASQQELRRRLAGVSAASAGSMGEDAAAFAFQRSRGASLGSVQLLKKDQDRATVAVTAREVTHEVTLVREGSEWRVLLPAGQPSAQ